MDKYKMLNNKNKNCNKLQHNLNMKYNNYELKTKASNMLCTVKYKVQLKMDLYTVNQFYNVLYRMIMTFLKIFRSLF